MKTKILIFLFALICGSISAQIPTEGLVGYWPFNNNANDVSGNGNNGVVNGATLTTDRFGNLNSAYNFKVNSDKITTSFPGVLGNDDRSISFWAKITESDNQSTGAVLHYGTGSRGRAWGMAIYSHYPVTLDINDATIAYKGSKNDDGKWHNYTYIFSTKYGLTQDGVKMYQDGVLLTESLGSYNPGSTVNTGSDIPFMMFGVSSSIDDIRFYDRILNTDEIKSLYNEGKCFETIYDTIPIYVHVPIYDTIPIEVLIYVYDTIPFYVPVYDTLLTTIITYNNIAVTDTLFIDVNLATEIQLEDINTLKVYPNPAKDYLTINMGNYTEMSDYSIKIINQLGETVFDRIITQAEYTIDLSSWSGKGLYVLRIYDKNNVLKAVKKIILQ